MKVVHSKDPRKSGFVEALKAVTGASRITDVKENKCTLQAELLTYDPVQKHYEALGRVQVIKGSGLGTVFKYDRASSTHVKAYNLDFSRYTEKLQA